jgi:hypothetical protein
VTAYKAKQCTICIKWGPYTFRPVAGSSSGSTSCCTDASPAHKYLMFCEGWLGWLTRSYKFPSNTNTRWFKYNRDRFVCKQVTVCPGHIWTTLYFTMFNNVCDMLRSYFDCLQALIYKVVQIWPGQTVTCLHTNSPGHIWTTLYIA